MHLVGAEVGHPLAHWLRVQRQVCVQVPKKSAEVSKRANNEKDEESQLSIERKLN